MSLSTKEAAESLSDVERAGKKSAEALCYKKSSPHLILWGVIWIIGYAGTEVLRDDALWLWALLVLAGYVASFVINRRYVFAPLPNASAAEVLAYRRQALRRSWRAFALMGIVMMFVVATYAIMWPVRGLQYAAFPSLLIGAAYAATGVFSGMRYVVTGLLLSALTLIGFFYLREYFLIWMAVIGGGALILAGFWFRKA